MKAYRYNAKKRSDRKFNTTGREKNPNKVKFYASNLAYAEEYRFVRDDTGEIAYECDLEVVELENVRLFDMQASFQTTDAYRQYINDQIGQQRADYTKFTERAKTKKDKAFWQGQIDALKNRESELANSLIAHEFQQLADYEYQDILITELREKQFDGYFTRNEIAIF